MSDLWASILTLPTIASRARVFADRLADDIGSVLAHIHASSADFFRPSRTGAGGKSLVPESVFSAVLRIALAELGWRVDREVQRAAGRTDLVLRRKWSQRSRDCRSQNLGAR